MYWLHHVLLHTGSALRWSDSGLTGEKVSNAMRVCGSASSYNTLSLGWVWVRLHSPFAVNACRTGLRASIKSHRQDSIVTVPPLLYRQWDLVALWLSCTRPCTPGAAYVPCTLNAHAS